ncbi:MAG: hypothetical protein GY850_15845 [bacterium]|nr:hypothetical protein [bacterium]
MISIDFDSGHIFLGNKSVPVKLTDNEGYLHLNQPDGPVLKALSVLERLRLIQYALTANDAPASLAASILHEATVKPGVGDYRLHEAVALYLAGGGQKAPPIYQSIAMVARHTGWHPDDIFSAEAAQIDHLASALDPSSSSKWTRVLMLDAGQGELDAYTNDLAASLIGRMDNSGNGEFQYDNRNQADRSHSKEANSSVDSSGGGQTPDKNTVTKDINNRERRNSGGIKSDTPDHAASKIADEYSTRSAPIVLKSGSSLNQSYENRAGVPSETGSNKPIEEESSPGMKKRFASVDGFTIKSQNHPRLKSEGVRQKKSVKADKSSAGKTKSKVNLSGPGAAKAGGRSVPGHAETPKLDRGNKIVPQITLKRESDQPQIIGIKSDSQVIEPQVEELPVHGIADDLPVDERRLAGHPRNDKQPAEPVVRRLTRGSQRGGVNPAAGSIDHEIAAFFGHRVASVADELAESLDREADLRGID